MEIRHRAAVLGSPIEHSRSPVMHNSGYRALGLDDWEYSRIEVDAAGLAATVRGADPSFVGFSVTMPGKFAALELADEVSERARLIGSANTLVRRGAGWFADNTDVDGVTGALSELFRGDLSRVTSAVIIGAGGTARPALWALADAGVTDITVLNRSDRSAELGDLVAHRGLNVTYVDFSADLLSLSRANDLIVSTVPSAGLAGHESSLGHAPILDVIYDPWPTPLTVSAASNGYPTVGGHVMLAHQAYPQFELFTGRAAPYPQMWDALLLSLAQVS
ncbi:shikimate dehydrogenase [Corynebacterium doosanense]|uniref:shikimate dehydrogenase n=1 Tax=Corynebacterium doosanense TaxID=1121358 RepID=UPI00036BB271|nr:shikimate dehydrogenase [Corynebacterium doosanense]